MQYILGMPINEALIFLREAEEKEMEEHIRQQWVSFLPFMSIGMLKYMSFNEYKNKCTGKNIDLRPADEIVKELEELHGTKLV